MDILDRVSELGAELPGLAPTQLDRARQALLREIAHAERGRQRRRWQWAVSAAATIAVVVAAALVTMLPMRPATAAADVLNDAAALSVTATSVDLGDGQFLEISQNSQRLQFWDVDMPEKWARLNYGSPYGAEAALRLQDSVALYVPANRNDDWILDERTPTTVIATYGARAGEAVRDWQAANPADRGSVVMLPGGLLTTPDGGAPTFLDERSFYPQMPRDPQHLLAWWRDRSGLTGAEADRWAVDKLATQLSVNLAPADLRAAMLRALGLIPNATVLTRDDESVTIAFPWDISGRDLTSTITLDTTDGLVTGSSVVETVTATGVVVSSTVALTQTRTTTRVVDSAPDGSQQ
jgi:hypothetical protein